MRTFTCTHVCVFQHKTHTHITALPSIFSAWTSPFIPNPPPTPTSPGASCFWDWFHLFNDGCANDPSHTADGVTDTTTSQAWGLDQELERKRQSSMKEEGHSRRTREAQDVFLKQTRALGGKKWKLIFTGLVFTLWHRWKSSIYPHWRLVGMEEMGICHHKFSYGSFVWCGMRAKIKIIIQSTVSTSL